MNILVTGACGRIGRYVVRELLAAGHDVGAVDRSIESASADARYLRTNLADAGQAYQAVTWAEPDAVVHMAAWPNAGMVPDTRTYGENVATTFNLLKACADLGVKRVVSASTNQIYGFAAAAPRYVPVDEDHPLRPANSYALSKIAGESAADYFVRNHDLTILSFRLMGVRTPQELPQEIEAMQADPAGGAWLLWTRTDARDAAMACRLAVEAPKVASGAYNITGAEVVVRRPTQQLVSDHFGDQTEVRAPLDGHVSPLSCAKARDAFGYLPHYVWNADRYHLDP